MARIEEILYSKDEITVIIRSPEVQDAKQLIEHVKKINSETTFLIREPEEFNFTIKKEENFIRSKISSEESLFLIAEINGKIIGSCTLNGSALKREKHKVDLGISLQKQLWGLGIGKKLMKVAVDWAKENNIKKVTLKVDTSNYRAINLYKKLGFEVEGRLIKDKYLIDGSYRNSYVMALLID